MGGGHTPPPRSRRMNNQKATVDVMTPALLIATRFRVAVPPVVVAGTMTTAYVPPLNGVRFSTRPVMASVHAAAPVDSDSALIVVVGVVAPVAVVSYASRTCVPEGSTSVRTDGSVDVHTIAPLRMATTSATG